MDNTLEQDKLIYLMAYEKMINTLVENKDIVKRNDDKGYDVFKHPGLIDIDTYKKYINTEYTQTFGGAFMVFSYNNFSYINNLLNENIDYFNKKPIEIKKTKKTKK